MGFLFSHWDAHIYCENGHPDSRKYGHWDAYIYVKIGIRDVYIWGCLYLLDTSPIYWTLLKYRTLGHVLSNNGQYLRAVVQYVLLFYLCSFKIYRVTCSYSDAHSYTLLIVGIKMCYLFHSCRDPKRTDPGTWATGSNWKRHCQRTSRVISTSHVCMLQNSCI